MERKTKKTKGMTSRMNPVRPKPMGMMEGVARMKQAHGVLRKMKPTRRA